MLADALVWLLVPAGGWLGWYLAWREPRTYQPRQDETTMAAEPTLPPPVPEKTTQDGNSAIHTGP